MSSLPATSRRWSRLPEDLEHLEVLPRPYHPYVAIPLWESLLELLGIEAGTVTVAWTTFRVWERWRMRDRPPK